MAINNQQKNTKYILAIDETGNFTMLSNDRSFVCGVVVTQNELSLKHAYQKTYSDLGFPEPIPDSTLELLTNNSVEKGKDNARFHFNKLEDYEKAFCKNNLMPFVDKIFISKDKPSLYANNQNWWLMAVTVVIKDFLKNYDFEEGSEVEIQIDKRKDTIWGMVYDKDEGLDKLSDNDRRDRFDKYHNNIKQQIENNVKQYAQSRGVDLKINFISDTSSLYVNLADIVCGFVRIDRKSVAPTIVECSCKSFVDGSDPVLMAKDNPLAALCIIFQEMTNNHLKNIRIVKDLLKRLRDNEEDYTYLWDFFYDFLKSKIAERSSISSLVRVKEFVDLFLAEFKNAANARVQTDQRLDLMVLFVEYYSHIGSVETPFSRDDVIEVLKKSDKNSETRILRKWEKLLSFTLRECQMFFNRYDFDRACETLETTWNKHESIVNLLKDDFEEKDEHTVALIGSVAQSYAYNDDFKNAIDYFNMSKEYVVRTSRQTDSYLFTISHRKKDVKSARECFVSQVGITPEQYYERNQYKDSWTLLSYFKLRALELHVEGRTELSDIDLQKLRNYNSEYPFPLVMKWCAIALYMEDKDANKQLIERYFDDAIENLLKEENGFTINTLALPIMQCYSLVDNKNQYHSKYDTIVAELKKRSSHFAKYVDERAPFLNNIKNEADLWQRAMSLPFIYA